MSNIQERARIPEFTFGDRLRKAREHAGVTTEEMAAAVDVSTRTVGNYENDRTPVRGPVVKVWAMRTGVPVEWLLTGRSDETPDDGGSDLGVSTTACNGDAIILTFPTATQVAA